MPDAGWYADPDGTPARLRWWDGTAWSPATTPDPRMPAADKAGYPGSAQSGWPPSQPSARGAPLPAPDIRRLRAQAQGRRGWTAIMILVVGALVLAFIWGTRPLAAPPTTMPARRHDQRPPAADPPPALPAPAEPPRPIASAQPRPLPPCRQKSLIAPAATESARSGSPPAATASPALRSSCPSRGRCG